MEQKNRTSEITRILQQIEAEQLAAQNGLTGLASVATHASIIARIERVRRDLETIVGKEDAIRLIAEKLEAISNPTE